MDNPYPNCTYSLDDYNESSYWDQDILYQLCNNSEFVQAWTGYRVLYLILFILVFCWSFLGFIMQFVQKKPKNLCFYANMTLTMASLFRVVFMLDPWGFLGFYGHALNYFLFFQFYTFAVFSLFLITGMWFEVINTRVTKADLKFKRSKIIALIVAAIWGVLAILLTTLEVFLNLSVLSLLCDIFLGVFAAIVLVYNITVGIILIKKLKKATGTEKTVKNITIFLFLIPLSIFGNIIEDVIFLYLRQKKFVDWLYIFENILFLSFF